MSSHHLQQQELVAFLYERFRMGRHITLLVSTLAALLAYVELSIQGRELWVLLWFAMLCLVMLLRALHLRRFLQIRNHGYFRYQQWHDQFLIGVVATGLLLGCGAALVMSYITINLQIILHSLLLTMSAGAIAYLSTSLRVYIVYMVTTMLPVTIWLFLQERSAAYLLSLIYLFFMGAGFISVKRMHQLVNDALYYRYDNETLIDDLQRLLQSVSQTNKALEKISTSDELTGVSSYRAFRVHLEDIWREYRDSKLPISLIKLNIDYFYEFNAHYGQEVSDLQLQQVARILNDQLTDPSQMVVRLHGAEFALLLPGTSCKDARQIALDIRKALAELEIEHVKSGCSAYLTMSIGVGSQSATPRSFSRELLVRVDTALRLAKERGRDRLEVLEA
ncbi:MAG TPA: GGDEF domain-containing protein [Gammaproteobacteria bacterium]|nr:GGDEF domain-containing protein [Gammaproteobacteria bacterium]